MAVEDPQLTRRVSTLKSGSLAIADLLKDLDIDGDGDIDEEDKKIAATLKSMDTDGDGTITLKELVKIGQGKVKDEKKIQNMKKLIIAVLCASLIFCGVMLALMIAANEASKEDTPDSSGNLKTVGGKFISTEETTSSLNLTQLPLVDLDDLKSLKDLMVRDINGDYHYYTITGFTWTSTSFMKLFTARHDIIIIDNGNVMLEFPDGTLTRLATRRLLAHDGVEGTASLGLGSVNFNGTSIYGNATYTGRDVDSDSESSSESGSQSGSDSESGSESESGSDSESGSEPESGSDSESESESESGSESGSDSDSESGPDSESGSKSQSDSPTTS